MSGRKKSTWWRFLPCISILILIFLFSAMPAGESDTVSHGIADPLAGFLSLFTGGASAQEMQDALNWIVRKTAHAMEYLALAISVLYAFWVTDIPRWKLALGTEVFCFFYAITDELHQYFVPGRYTALIDIIIDSSGALFGIVLFYLFSNIIRKRK